MFQKLRDKVVRPQELCFTQDSICVTFQKPRNQERIDDAVDLIIQGRLSPKAFPKLNVVQFQDRLWSLDNRRLWVFRKAQVQFITVTIVSLEFHDKFSTLPSTSPYLYASLSKPDFLPRIRGFCKEIFAEDEFDGQPASLSPPPTPHVRGRPGQVPSKIHKQSIHHSTTFPSIPKPKIPSKHQNFLPPKAAPTSQYNFSNDGHRHEPLEYDYAHGDPFDYDSHQRQPVEYDYHHGEPIDYDKHQREHVENGRQYRGPAHVKKYHSEPPHSSKMRSSGPPSLMRSHGSNGPSLPESKKRSYDAANHSSRTPHGHEDFRIHSRRSRDVMQQTSSKIHAAGHHISKTREEAVRRMPSQACSPSAQKRRAPVPQVLEYEVSSAAPQTPVPATPEEHRSRSRSSLPNTALRTSSFSRKATTTATYSVRGPGKSKGAPPSGNLPPHYRAKGPKTVGSTREASGKHHHHELPPLPVDRSTQRGGDYKNSKSRVSASPLPAPKRSKSSKPLSNPKPFSYEFHSGPKKSRPSPKSSKKTLSSPKSKSQLNFDSGQTSIPSSVSPKDPNLSPKVIPEAPLPSLSTIAPLPTPTTQTPENVDCHASDLPIPSVPAPKSPPATCSPNVEDKPQGGDDFGTTFGPDPPDNNQEQPVCGISPTTEIRLESPTFVDGDPKIDISMSLNEERKESPGLASCILETNLLSEAEESLFRLDKKPAFDPELPLPQTPSQELNPKAEQTPEQVRLKKIVDEFADSLHTPQKKLAVENTPKESKEAEIIHQLQSLTESPTPIELIDLTQQSDETEDFPAQGEVSASVVECPVHSHIEGDWVGSYRPELKTTTEYDGYTDVRLAVANVDVTVTTGLEASQPQESSIPVRTEEVPETQFAATADVATDNQHLPRENKYWRKGYYEMERTTQNDVSLKLFASTQVFSISSGKQVHGVYQRITRGQVKKEKERERRERRKRRKESEAEKKKKEEDKQKQKEKELEKKQGNGSKTLMERKCKSASTNLEIVPYDAAKVRKAPPRPPFGSGDMVYVKVQGEIVESGTEEQKSTGSTCRQHPYMRIIGPFRVQKLCNAYSAALELPDDCDLKPIFNLTVLQNSKCEPDNDMGKKRLPIALKPEAILYKRIARRLRKQKIAHYLVKWTALPATEATWEPESIIDENPFLLDQIHCPLFNNPFMFRNWRA